MYRKLKKIFDYVKGRVSYDNSSFYYVYDSQGRLTGTGGDGNAKSHSAGSIFFSSKAVCEGYTKGAMYLFSAAGILGYTVDISHVYGNLYQDGNYSRQSISAHAFNLVKIEGKYFIFDLTDSKKNGFLVSGPLHVKRRSLDDISKWKVYDSSKNKVNNSWTGLLNNGRGNLNFDQKIDSADQTLLNKYIKGSSAEKDQIIAKSGVSKALFETIADADCNNQITQNDSNTLYYEYIK